MAMHDGWVLTVLTGCQMASAEYIPANLWVAILVAWVDKPEISGLFAMDLNES